MKILKLRKPFGSGWLQALGMAWFLSSVGLLWAWAQGVVYPPGFGPLEALRRQAHAQCQARLAQGAEAYALCLTQMASALCLGPSAPSLDPVSEVNCTAAASAGYPAPGKPVLSQPSYRVELVGGFERHRDPRTGQVLRETPIWQRLGLRVFLEPGRLRLGGPHGGERFYPKEAFSGVEGPLGSWTRVEVWPGVMQPYHLRLGWRFSPSPLFYLVFGEERVPLWLDLPGWDRMLAHLGLDWRDHPGLRRYLLTARGLAWLNGLLYPPADGEEAWRQARDRYRRVSAWLWASGGLMGLGFV